MLRFYATQITEDYIFLDENDSRHAIKSLRLNIGEKLEIVDGFGTVFTCEIEIAHHKKCKCKILEKEKKAPLPYTLHMAVAPTKNIDRFEWFLEKATELGISEITPIICANSERKNIKPERLERILVAAMKQSLKAKKPILNKMLPLKDFLKTDIKGHKLIAHCETGQKININKLEKANNNFTILIGPEGDFNLDEIKLATEIGFKPLSLGKSRLRTETAALFSVATVYQKYI